MAILPIVSFLSLCHILTLCSGAQNLSYQHCPQSFACGTQWPNLSFPFANIVNPLCGLLTVNCTDQTDPQILFQYGEAFGLINISKDSVTVKNPRLEYLIEAKSCIVFFNHTISNKPSISFSVSSQNITLFKCNDTTAHVGNFFHGFRSYKNCSGFTIYYSYLDQTQFSQRGKNIPNNCEVIQVPLSRNGTKNSSDVFSLFGYEYSVRYHVSDNCTDCRERHGQCMDNQQNYICVRNEDKGDQNILSKHHSSSYLKVILGTVIPGCAVLIITLVILTIRYRKKWKDSTKYIPSRNMSSDPSSKSDIEGGAFLFGVHEFSYAELEEATNCFDPSRELGDGGFGAVYYGKLRDGREVAVKRLYEHNYKRMIQFRNEIEILTRLHHKNLVTLYGCTSCQSRELLLVYEYISNGTVNDHLHGDLAKDKQLTWHNRINIAIETASALSYLHKSDVIHRDVKTSNILLDNNFCVKVADFGLSRLFPNDVTHVSTAPQGTPGYVDPEYHHCYQLTDKSDVYSFGVVLVELLSSMPVIDVHRNKYEISLANFAMNKIQNGAWEELIDPSLGFESDPSVQRMITSVAEVVFRCLQLEKEMRPSMDEVLDTLREIQDYKQDGNGKEMDTNSPRHSLEADDAVLLKTNVSPSPNSIANNWVSSSSSISSG